MAKLINQIVVLALSCFLLISCAKKETFNNTPDKVGHSNVIFFATVETNGEHVVVINQGDAFTDEGATAILNDQPVEYTTTGSVDVNTPGIYVLDYDAANEQGYTANDFRAVVVLAPDVAANDFSGSYVRSATGEVSVWTKTGAGVYSVTNPGGAVGAGFSVTVVNYAGNTVAIPQQPSSVGTFSSTDGEHDGNGYTWAVVNGGYGTADRTFVKQ